MARTVWMVLGAAGGIYAYRKTVRAAAEARERGFVGNINAAANGITRAAGSARTIAVKTNQVRTAAADAIAPDGPASLPANDSRLRTWSQPRSDAASSPSSPSAATPSSRAPR
ncbi:MAG: hypothetical protein ACH36H_05045 [Candidatus Nanopelagicales bacterium]